MTGDFEIWKFKKLFLVLLWSIKRVIICKSCCLSDHRYYWRGFCHKFFLIYTYSSPIIFLLSNLKLQHMMFIVQSRYNDFLYVIYRFYLTDKFLSIVIFCRSWLIERIRMKLLFVLDKASHWTASLMLLPNHCTPVDCCLTLHQPPMEKEAENQGIQERWWRAGGCIH